MAATRAVVVENRQPVGYDEGIGSSGALVYTVGASVRSGDGPVRVVDSTPGPADGLDDVPFAAGSSSTEPTTGAVLTSATDRRTPCGWLWCRDRWACLASLIDWAGLPWGAAATECVCRHL